MAFKYNNSNIDEWFFTVDKCVLNALELFKKKRPPVINLGDYKRPLVVGSGNAAETGKILYEDKDAIPATESTYERELNARGSIDGAIVISASGGKSSVAITKTLRERGLEARLITCNPEAPAAEFIDKDKIFVTPRNPEPYTFNTSTYMGMILGKTREDPAKILEHLKGPIKEELNKYNFSKTPAFFIMIDKKFSNFMRMIQIKFEELFGRRVARDFYTPEFVDEHATDIVDTPGEVKIAFGCQGPKLTPEDIYLPLPKGTGYGTLMAMGYYAVGRIQSQKPSWFKERIVNWVEARGINPFVE